MKSLNQIRELLSELIETTCSPIYEVCGQIILHLEKNPKQYNLTIGGMRAALNRSSDGDNILINALFTLSLPPFEALKVRYRLYNSSLTELLEEVDQAAYLFAMSEGYYVDIEGNEILLENLNARIFPFFVNNMDHDKGHE